MIEEKPEVGIGVLIFKDGKVLLGKRKSQHAKDTFAPPGGKLDYLESFEACAKREVKEETGLEIANLQFICLRNTKEYPPKHYVNIGFRADWLSGEPTLMEPEKSEVWKWYDLEALPEPLFAVVPMYLESIKTGKHYFDN